MKSVIWMVLLSLGLAGCQSGLMKKVVKAPEVKSIQLKQFSIQDKSMVFDVGLFNPNAFALPIDSADGMVRLNGVDIGRFAVQRKQKLEAKKVGMLTLPITLDAKALGKAVRSVFEQGKASYYFQGGVDTGIVKVPFSQEGKLSVQDIFAAMMSSWGRE